MIHKNYKKTFIHRETHQKEEENGDNDSQTVEDTYFDSDVEEIQEGDFNSPNYQGSIA